MPRTTRVAVNGSGGANVNITCTMPCRRVEILEDGGATAQGYTFTPTGGSAENVPATSSQQDPLVLGNKVAHGNAKGAILGFPAQTGYPMNSPATVYGVAKSLTATAITLLVTEYE